MKGLLFHHHCILFDHGDSKWYENGIIKTPHFTCKTLARYTVEKGNGLRKYSTQMISKNEL